MLSRTASMTTRVSITSQYNLKCCFEEAQTGFREEPFTANKKATKKVRLAEKDETIQTWIDTGDDITLECERTVGDGVFIVISDSLKNSDKKKHEYFIKFEDFVSRYTMLNGDLISEPDMFKIETTVKAKGVVTAFKALEDDTFGGKYENPESWGEGVASGATEDGYWISSQERPNEFYFMPTCHFERDYERVK